MTTDERTEMHIAQCHICTLGNAMKHCATCPFRIGLVKRVDEVAAQRSAPTGGEILNRVLGKVQDAAWYLEMLAQSLDAQDLHNTQEAAR